MSVIALRQPLIGGLAAGKWDRFATFGHKVQNGQEFDFTEDTLGQIVDNFARLWKGRRLGMDHEHQTIHAERNGQPAPQLAYYNALCIVQDGKLARFYAQKPDVAQPNPEALLAEMRERFPDYDTADGLWGFRCEHTPLGQQLLPNYEQISPLFAADGTDEQEKPVGYVLMNVAAVSVAFQDGTIFNLRALGFGDSSLHVPEPVKTKGAKMAEEKKDEGEGKNALRSECMKKFGLPDDSSDDALFGALMATKMMGDDAAEESEEDKKKKEAAAASALSDAPEMPPAAMGKVLKRLEEEAAARQVADARVAALEDAERNRAVAAFRATALSRLVDQKEADEWLADFGGDIGKATRALSRLPEKKTGLFSRLTENGAPIGADPVQQGSGVENVAGLKIIGRGLSAMSQTILAKGEAKTLGEAQLIAARRAPHLYSR